MLVEILVSSVLLLVIGVALFAVLQWAKWLLRPDFEFLQAHTDVITQFVDSAAPGLGFAPSQLVIERTRRGDLRIAYRKSLFACRSDHRCVLAWTGTPPLWSVRQRPGATYTYEAHRVTTPTQEQNELAAWLQALSLLPGVP
jgi:hypothetical protein